MEIKNYSKRETRYYIGRINKDNVRESLRLDVYNALPTVIRDQFDIGRGFANAQTANQGVNFFNSVEVEKGDNRNYWYFVVNVTNIETVPLNDRTDPKIVEYFNNVDKEEEEEETRF